MIEADHRRYRGRLVASLADFGAARPTVSVLVQPELYSDGRRAVARTPVQPLLVV